MPEEQVNILLVDDIPENLVVLEAVLENPKYNLISARSGPEALKRLLQDDYAVILLDVMMPGMDGFETAQLIRQRERCQHTPIVFVTAIGRSDAHVFKGYSVGAVDYLFKPLVPEVLQAKVAAFVELFQKTQTVREQADQLREMERREHEGRLAEAQRQLEAERYRQEMRVARDIHRRLFPKKPPQCRGFDIWGASYPAEETGGDYFDYYIIDDGSLDVVVGDVSGHGYGPALIMSATRAYLRAMAMSQAQMPRMLGVTNRALVTDTQDGHFVTLLLTRLDLEKQRLTYCNAGHLPGFVLDRKGKVKLMLQSEAMPLGIAADQEFPASESVQLEPGDLLLLYTDGLTEANNDADEQFGIERALEVVRAHQHERAERIGKALFEANRRFAGHKTQVDDVTMVVVCVPER